MKKSQLLIKQGKAWDAIQYIVAMMLKKKKSLSNDEWSQYIKETVRNSHLKEFALLCPLTRRSFEKPRGYSGDAVMMDYIYGTPEAIQNLELDTISEEVFRFCTNSPVARAVRFRRRLMAKYIDEACAKNNKTTNLLSVACGHLREIDLSIHIKQKNFDQFFAIDQDSESLKVIEKCYTPYGISPQQVPIKNLITGRTKLETQKFHLIYSAGLYDYLNPTVAEKLTNQLFSYVAPGGKLLIANFLPDIPDFGYMESLMDWWLIDRNPSEMDLLAGNIPSSQIKSKKLFKDPGGNIIFLELEKAS